MSSIDHHPRIVSGPIALSRGARVWLVLAVLGLAVLMGGAAWLWARWENRLVHARNDRLGVELAAARAQMDELRQQLAVAERSAQITDEANRALREDIEGLQDTIAGLKADNEFYRRLLGTGGASDGLAVHAVQLESLGSPRTFRFLVTLSQNLKKARVVSGTAELVVEGVQDDRVVQLDTRALDLKSDQGDLQFEFKYFQQLGGSFALPAAFEPSRLTVRLRPEENGRKLVSRDFDWSEIQDSSGTQADEAELAAIPETQN